MECLVQNNHSVMSAELPGNDIERALGLIKSFGNAVFISESQVEAERLAAQAIAGLNSQGLGRQAVRMDTAALLKLTKEEVKQRSRPIIGTTDMAGFRKLEGIPELAGSLQFILTAKTEAKPKRNRSVLIIGASSFLGRAVYTLFSREYVKVRGTAFRKAGLFGFDKLDVTSAEEIKQYFLRHPDFDIIVYIAGEANADTAEKEKERTRLLNSDAVGIIGRYAGRSKFVYISSEYVFDGNSGPYASGSAAHPLNYYGRSKLEGERAALENFSDLLILRLGALYGYNGPEDKQTSVGKIISALDKDAPLEADNLQIKHPVLLEDAAMTLLKLLDYGASGIYQVNGPEGLNKQQMAERIAQIRRELTGRIFAHPVVGAEQAGCAARPLDTHMVNVDTPKPFNEGIRFLLEKQGLAREKKA